VQGTQVAAEPKPVERRAVTLRARRVSGLLGVVVPWAEALAVLERLGCEVAEKKDDAQATVLVPTHRPDIGREVDLVEEIIRVRGMAAVPAALPAIRATRDVGGREALAARARRHATALGLSEAITYGFTSREVLLALRAPEAAVVLRNPLGEHTAVMRTTLLAGLLDAVKNARRHGERDVREFTLGPVFLGRDARDGLPREELRLAAVLAGDRPVWVSKPSPLDAWDAKGLAEALARRLAGPGADVRVEPAPGARAPAHLHPRGAGIVLLGGAPIGAFGPLHPDVVDALALDGEVLAIELSLEPFVAGPKVPRYAPIPRFPTATRDVALVVKDGVPAGDVERAVREAAGALAEDVRIFDRFTGGQVPAGHASLAFHVVYRAPDRTLTDAEVDAAHASVVKAVGERFGATLRQ
jgi:phenylalanyl-tRNA synthetase beta chain